MNLFTGVTGQCIQKRSFTLFKPYQSKSDFFYRAATIATAPIFFMGVTVAFAVEACSKFIQSITNAIGNLFVGQSEQESAMENLYQSFISLVAAFFSACLVLASPIINAFDLFGGALTTFVPGFPVPVEENTRFCAPN